MASSSLYPLFTFGTLYRVTPNTFRADTAWVFPCLLDWTGIRFANHNLGFLSVVFETFVDLIQEVNLYLKDPEKYYSLSTVDLFLDVIGKGMSTRVCIFNIDASGKINEVCRFVNRL